MIDATALTPLLDQLAVEIAKRVLAELRAEPPTATTTDEPWRLLNVAEVSERLGRSERWVREKAKSGQLPWVRLDAGPLAFRLEDVQAFASDHRVPALASRLPGYGNASARNGSSSATRSDQPGVQAAEPGERL